MALATSFSERPASEVSERSTLTLRVGCANACWMRASAIPGICLTFANSALAYLRSAGRSPAGHLQVDRRRRAEIQNLTDDISGRKANVVPGNCCGSFSRMDLM